MRLCVINTIREKKRLCQDVLFAHEFMTVDIGKLISVVRRKRDADGLSLRGLSSIIGVSFSTLARIERGDGEPDNNSLIRILEWLGGEGSEFGLTFKNVAFVHFRANRNVNSKTVQCLLNAAEILKYKFGTHDVFPVDGASQVSNSEQAQSDSIPLSKVEMEDMAQQFRRNLGLEDIAKIDALGVKVEGVTVFVPSEVDGLDKKCLTHLRESGLSEWSAMSVPLDLTNETWAILRNDKHSIERQRVTYLEECWHILLGHKLTKIAKIADAYGRTYDSNEEHDAYYLASASLLPAGAMSAAVANRDTAAAIAERFDTSQELVEYRIKRLGLWLTYKAKEVSMTDNKTQS